MDGPYAVAALDSTLLGGLHTSGRLREILGERALIEQFLVVEQALAEAQADVGMIPSEAAEQIAVISIDDLDLAALASRSTEVGYPIVGVVEQLAALVPDRLGEFAHWGATTQDIMDTALVLQVRAAVDVVASDLRRLVAALAKLATEHCDTIVVGRSQMQQAMPTTMGLSLIHI